MTKPPQQIPDVPANTNTLLQSGEWRISPADELAVARNVTRVHRERPCRLCTVTGCPAEEWTVTVVFDAVAANTAEK